jgi:hypothetical protein
MIARRQLGGVVGGTGVRDARLPAGVFPRGIATAGPLSSYPQPYSPHRVASGTAGRVGNFGLVLYAGHTRLGNADPEGVAIKRERSDDVTPATSPAATAPQAHLHPTALLEHRHAPLLRPRGHPTGRGSIPRDPAILATGVFPRCDRNPPLCSTRGPPGVTVHESMVTGVQRRSGKSRVTGRNCRGRNGHGEPQAVRRRFHRSKDLRRRPSPIPDRLTKRIEPRRGSPGASVDPTGARKATV